MKRQVHLSSWKSPAKEERFRAREADLALAVTSEQPVAVAVPSRLGPTRAYRWDGADPPVMFLHGATGTALSWTAYAERRHGRAMTAIDTIGDVGASQQEVAVENA